MYSAEIQNRIKQFNPWLIEPDKAKEFIGHFLPDLYINREDENRPLPQNLALLIVGPRQAGKSTLVWHLLQRYLPEILFLNMEDPLLRLGCQPTAEFINLLKNHYSFIKAIFIDETQHLPEAGLVIKGLIDARLNLAIFVTGSLAFHLRSKTRESLAGRVTRKRLLPFSMRELMTNSHPPNPLAARHLSEQIMAHQLIYGSYPAVYLAKNSGEKIILLNNLVEALILKDVSDIFRIKRVDAFRKLLTLLAGQIGQIINFSELAAICQVDVGTIRSYVEILEESHVVKIVTPFAGGKRREITGAPKVFFLDNGIRNQLLNNFSPALDLRTDRGQLLENWVFSEIYKSAPLPAAIKYWRSKTGAEVDFIIEYAGKIYGLEVKYTLLKQPKLPRAARSFLDVYAPENFSLLNSSLEQEVTIGNRKVSFITPYGLSRLLYEIFG
ncbi:MAG: ATP-binding protein [Deltaproteobacteria bacterium]|nr:ATP-binding protein [Deltaproteobacteria bacterium]